MNFLTNFFSKSSHLPASGRLSGDTLITLINASYHLKKEDRLTFGEEIDSTYLEEYSSDAYVTYKNTKNNDFYFIIKEITGDQIGLFLHQKFNLIRQLILTLKNESNEENSKLILIGCGYGGGIVQLVDFEDELDIITFNKAAIPPFNSSFIKEVSQSRIKGKKSNQIDIANHNFSSDNGFNITLICDPVSSVYPSFNLALSACFPRSLELDCSFAKKNLVFNQMIEN